jgi:predicted Rossmann fold nucleotide-binding protein DprA/Smf involved in DNA uptake
MRWVPKAGEEQVRTFRGFHTSKRQYNCRLPLSCSGAFSQVECKQLYSFSGPLMKFIALEELGVGRTTIYRGLPNYPSRLATFLGDHAPAVIWVAGNPDILERVDSGTASSLALIASVRSPMPMLDLLLSLMRPLSEANITFVGGFHAPLERRCLDLLLKTDQQALICLARTLVAARVPSHWQHPLVEGRLLILSPFPGSLRRPTTESARVRNECVAALASGFLIPHASPRSKTELQARALVNQGRPVWTLDHPANGILLQLGARPTGAGFLEEIRKSRCP